jgi:hypothetical protein
MNTSMLPLVLLLTSCTQLGYVKVDFVGNKTDTQACSFADDFAKG